MDVPELAPRSGIRGMAVCWAVAAAMAVAIGVFAPAEWRAAWMTVGMGANVVVAFIVHVAEGRPQGFIQRVGASVLGSFVVMGLIGLGVGLVTMFAG